MSPDKATRVRAPRQRKSASEGRTESVTINHIGTPGALGFGVGICPGPLPAGMGTLPGTEDPSSDNYGNYQFSDKSVMVWLPAFYYLYGTGANGLTVNAVDVKPLSAYADVAAANAAGYALHRAFYDGDIQLGVFVDKFLCGNNGGVASSLKLGNPLSSYVAHNPFSGLTGSPANAYYGAIAAAKTRGADFFCNTRFIFSALALLSVAHAQASSSDAYCAWYAASGVSAPRGCNNSALGDTHDKALAFVGDGYFACAKTGSASVIAKTAHNGQNSGVVDLNGNMWEITPGLTTNDAGTAYYALKASTRIKDVTGGTGGATDLWGAAGIEALYEKLGATFGAVTARFSRQRYGNAAQVLSEATSGAAWQQTGLGVPLVGGVGGSDMFGHDVLYSYRPPALCPISGGSWDDSSAAGVWAFLLYGVRGSSHFPVGFRAALFL